MAETGTPLDRAHRAMEADPQADAARLRFYERLADAELMVLLEAEAEAGRFRPRVFPVEEGPLVLAFDTEERLAEFAGGAAHYAALSGRALAALLAAEGLGLGLNLGVAPSATVLPAGAVGWLAGTLAAAPEPLEARVAEFRAPSDLPEALLLALDTKLAAAAGLAEAALLVAVRYAGGGRGHMLAFTGARPAAEPALVQAVSEVLAFSGLEAGTLDVAFPGADDPALARLAKVALRYDLPAGEVEIVQAPPGSDPERPPRLR